MKSFQPYPAFPYNLAPRIDGIWFVIGAGILLYLWATKKDQWIEKLGAASVEADNLPAAIEDAHFGA